MHISQDLLHLQCFQGWNQDPLKWEKLSLASTGFWMNPWILSGVKTKVIPLDLSRDQEMPLACLKLSRGRVGSTLKCYSSDAPTCKQEAKRSDWSKLLCSAIVSPFLSCLTLPLPRADLCDSGLFLAALLGELESGLLFGVYLSICFLIHLFIECLRSDSGSTSPHLFSTSAQAGQKGSKRGRFAPCCEDEIGKSLKIVSPPVLMLLQDGKAGKSNRTVEGAGGRVSGSSSFSAAGFPHSHAFCNAMLLVTNFPKSMTA